MVTKEQLEAFVENNPKLVTRKESGTYPGLFVLKYARKVFYDNLWTPELELCRGLILDSDWNIVVRPFTKIYNRGERNTDFHRDDIVTAVEKKNGFMAAVTYHSTHGQIISTTGSLDSDYVKLARKYVEPYFDYIKFVYCRTNDISSIPMDHLSFTWLFEICSPDDPHIIEEAEGAYLIGTQHCTFKDFKLPEGVLDTHAHSMNALRPKWYRVRFGSLVQELKDCTHEGYVVHNDDGRSLKMKSPYYLTCKALARGNFDKICAGAKDRIDEEFYPLIDHINENKEHFTTLEEQDKLVFIREFLRK